LDSLTDNQLMAMVRVGEVEKLGVLFERHHVALFNFFLRLTGARELSEDLVQDVFLRMLKYRHTFQPRSEFRPWMFQIARNAQFDALRKRQRDRVTPESEHGEEPVCEEPTPDSRAGRTQEVRLLEQAMARLSHDKREVLLLSRIQDMDHDEVAAILGCEPATVRVRLHRALKDLKVEFHLLAEGRFS
jgi:RNA polymerase sigma factor (sigma-70 family)